MKHEFSLLTGLLLMTGTVVSQSVRRLDGPVLALALLLAGIPTIRAQTSVSYNFATAGQLTNCFNDGYAKPAWTQNTSGGISGGGYCNIPSGSNDLHICTQGFPLQVGASYTVSAYLYNVYNSGYGGLGFTALTTGTINGGYATPLSTIGVSFHGGGGFMDNNSASTAASTSVTWTTGVVNTAWYYFVLTLTCTAANTFSQTINIYTSSSSGGAGTLVGTATATGQVNAALGGAANIYPFMGASQSRFTEAGTFAASTTAIVMSLSNAVSWHGIYGGGGVGQAGGWRLSGTIGQPLATGFSASVIAGFWPKDIGTNETITVIGQVLLVPQISSVNTTTNSTLTIATDSGSQYGITRISLPAPNTASLIFLGQPDASYLVERSLDLSIWKEIWVTNAPAIGVFSYTDNFGDLNGQAPRSAFYRLVKNSP